MWIRKHSDGLEIYAPAKLNLSLNILGKRPDGFHEIDTLVLPIDWYDLLYFRPLKSSRSLELEIEQTVPSYAIEQRPRLSSRQDNLILKALSLLRIRTGYTGGMSIRIVKSIPWAAGLAGGSSNAAASLFAGNLLWNLGLSQEELKSFGAELGSDIPLFFQSSATRCQGRGELLEAVPQLSGLHFVVLSPRQGLSTADVFRSCQIREGMSDCSKLIQSLRTGDLRSAGQLMHNDLQEAAERLLPEMVRLRKQFDQYPVAGHQMSGSGTSYFALCYGANQARRIARQLHATHQGDVRWVRSFC
ncbi:4-diphosphocytidyl-2-C-methyl-D-erythritol kinase [Planctomycetales bacterium 10988]|nr:4-diphosphocytidyl-2-C-methyl-D-erythritol kinase [Planctomycetales bacterium 10988]